MDLPTIERICQDIRKHLLRAKQHQDAGDTIQMRAEAETAAALFRKVNAEADDPLGISQQIRAGFAFFGFTEAECDSLLASKKKKIDVKGRSSGGAEHKKGKRPSTTGKHQKGAPRNERIMGAKKGMMVVATQENNRMVGRVRGLRLQKSKLRIAPMMIAQGSSYKWLVGKNNMKRH